MFARAILHTKLATPAHLRAAAVDYQRLLDRMRGTASVDPLSSNLGERSLIMGNLAETFMMLGDLDRAIETYREAQRLSPELNRAFGLAVALDRDEQEEPAYEVLRGQGPGRCANTGEPAKAPRGVSTNVKPASRAGPLPRTREGARL